MRRLAVSVCLLVVVATRPVVALSGAPPIVVLGAFRTGFAHTTLASLQQEMTTRDFPTFWTRTSYGAYRPFIADVRGWFEVPSDSPCGGYDESVSAYPQRAEQAALAAGVVFPVGSIPVVIAPDCGHVEKPYTSTLSNTAYGRGLFTDGKLFNDLLGHVLGLGVAGAINTPSNAVNNFDPYTPLGHTDQARMLTGLEQADAHIGWISGSQVLSGVTTGTNYIEAVEQAPTGAIKLWKFPNFINIDVRQLGGTAVPFIHISHSLIDLEATACNQYALPPGQVYSRNGFGYRNDGVAPGATGVTVTVFPFTGPSTVTCVGGPGSFQIKGGGTPPPPPPPCTKNCTPPPPPTTETNCTDGIDNDNDGLTDAADPDCHAPPPPPPPSGTPTPPKELNGALNISCGEIVAQIRPNSDNTLSGIGMLLHAATPTYSPFTYGGANFEHVIRLSDQGPLDTANHTMLFTPRYGPMPVTRIDATTVKLTRLAADEPFNMDAVQYFHCSAPHAIDFHGEFTPRDASLFAADPTTGLVPGAVFIASYMAPMGALDHWIKTANGWVLATYPPTPYSDKGGIYRGVGAPQYPIDPAKQDQLDVYTYESPQFTTPIMVHRASNGMVFATMWAEGDVRPTQMRWVVKNPADPAQWKPADDWEFWWPHTVTGETHTIRARYLWFYLPNSTDAEMLAAVDAAYAAWVPWVAAQQ